jgi:hypothetical protein
MGDAGTKSQPVLPNVEQVGGALSQSVADIFKSSLRGVTGALQRLREEKVVAEDEGAGVVPFQVRRGSCLFPMPYHLSFHLPESCSSGRRCVA